MNKGKKRVILFIVSSIFCSVFSQANAQNSSPSTHVAIARADPTKSLSCTATSGVVLQPTANQTISTKKLQCVNNKKSAKQFNNYYQNDLKIVIVSTDKKRYQGKVGQYDQRAQQLQFQLNSVPAAGVHIKEILLVPELSN